MVRSSTILWAAKRVPSIRFRKGGNAVDAAVSHSAGSASQVLPAQKSGARAASSFAIEDYDLPARFQRKPIDQFEIDYINRGGRE